jgi:hypothetical protein
VSVTYSAPSGPGVTSFRKPTSTPAKETVASQADSSLHLFAGGTGRPVVRTAGQPADIGVDTRRNRVAVPYISLDRVDIWDVPRP